MTRKVLGRGLEALITESPKKDKESIERVSVDSIRPNRYQPRVEFSREKLNELIASIKEKGVVQPILIRPSGDGYELITGERRLRAVKALGYGEIPAVIKNVDDINAIELSLIENIQREELNPIDEARAYERLMDEFAYTQEMVAQAVGKDRSTVANNLRLLSLPKEVITLISKNLISEGHAKVLLSVEGAGAQIELARKAVKNGLSVRSLEDLARRKRPAAKKRAALDNDIRMVEERIQQRLGTKVRITPGKKRGTIQIEYYSNADLERILKALGCV